MSTFVVVQLFWALRLAKNLFKLIANIHKYFLLSSKSVDIQHIVPANKLVDHVPLKQMHL